MPDLPTPFARAAGGLTWRVHAWGGFDKPPLVLLHGFGSDGRCWAPLAAQLAAAWRVLAVDLPGHGGTHLPSAAAWDLPLTARALGTLVQDIDHRPPVVLGYSLGGRLAVHLALQPAWRERLGGLVLVGASAGLPDARARADRLAADALWIQRLSQGLETFWSAWDEQPVFATRRALPRFTRAFPDFIRQGQDAGQLAAAMAAFGLGRMAPVHDKLGHIQAPVRLLVGERDDKFRALAEDLLAGLPHAQLHLAPGAGHDVPLEAPESILCALQAFESNPSAPLGASFPSLKN
jgi:2-succinyl-6-hydroxy-2,4-cyclohexadiene-1-carboxylate synthase